jgi:trigger factor
VAHIEGCKHSLEITVPVADVEKETERVVADIQKKVRLPGFRPGKAPLSLVKSRFTSEINQDVLEALVPRFFHEAAAKDGLQVVGRPNVVDVHFHAGEPIKFKAEFEVAPTFELAAYKGVTITYAEPQVSDADVAERIENIREQKAEYVNEEPRPLVDGDFAVVSLESLSGVDKKISQDEMMMKIGDEATMAGFSENLRGAAPDETREFEISYPADYDRENLAGRTVKFRAVLKHVRRKELPELNDEFAKDLGDFQTLEELRNTVRSTIQQERDHKAQDDAKHQILDKLVDTHEFPVPDAYVDRQIEMNMEQQFRQLSTQGIDPSKLNLDWAKLREAQAPRALRDVRASLLLDKVSEVESIAATQEEIDSEIAKIARNQRETVPMIKAKLQKEGGLNRISGHIRTEKTLRFLFENARKEAPAAS